MPCHNFVSSYSASVRNNTLINNWISNIIDCFIVQRSLHAIDLYNKSGAVNKSDFVRARILGESFKVIMVDKSAV